MIYFTQGSMKQVSIRVYAWDRRMAKPKHNNRSHTVVLCVMTLGCHLIQTDHFHVMAEVKLKSNCVPPKWWHSHPTLWYCHNPENCDMNFITTNNTIIKILS